MLRQVSPAAQVPAGCGESSTYPARVEVWSSPSTETVTVLRFVRAQRVDCPRKPAERGAGASTGGSALGVRQTGPGSAQELVVAQLAVFTPVRKSQLVHPS